MRAEIDKLKKDMAVANEKHTQTVSNIAAATALELASQDEVRAVRKTTVERVKMMVRKSTNVRVRVKMMVRKGTNARAWLRFWQTVFDHNSCCEFVCACGICGWRM